MIELVEAAAELGTALDWEYLLGQLRPLVEVKEAPEIMTRLEALRLRM